VDLLPATPGSSLRSVDRAARPASAAAAAAGLPLSDALERGEIVSFGPCPLALPSLALPPFAPPPEDDLAFLRSLGPLLGRKNVSWYCATDRLKGIQDPQLAARARAILSAHAGRVRAFLSAAMPAFARGMRPGTSSMRPLQEKGRGLSPHASNELLHVDAGAYGATHGDRILRFFVNVSEREDRVWITRGAFPALYARHARDAGLVGARGQEPIDDGPLDKAFTALIRGAAKVWPEAQVLDSSPYDRQMRRLHNWMKDTPAYQQEPQGLETIRFPPGHAWMCLTDQVTHACIEGQHALIDTFLVPLANCRLRALSPHRILSTGQVPSQAQR
jgi:3-deoxy-D-manno-oct-2-ulosonic acid (Kdo) hydroxylase